MREFFRATLLLAAVVGIASLLTGCPPKYPLCKTDEHCEEKGEVCINGQCQQCKDDSNCQAGFICRDYKCVPKPECTTNAECAPPLVCRNEKCVPECTTDAECASGFVCRNQKCVPAAECYSDYDCKENHQCIEGKCVYKAPPEPECALQTINFDFDDYSLRSDARSTLDRNADCMKMTPAARVSIEGNCDERGTTEYNYALGEKRANSAKKYMQNIGVDPGRITTRSYGEDRPVDQGHNEDAWARNRRDEFILSK